MTCRVLPLNVSWPCQFRSFLEPLGSWNTKLKVVSENFELELLPYCHLSLWVLISYTVCTIFVVEIVHEK